MKYFEYCHTGETFLIGGRQYRAGDLLTSYMNLSLERLDALHSACLAQKNALLRFERSEEYGRTVHRCMDTFDIVDKLVSKLSPYSRMEGENITLAGLVEKSPLFRGFDVVSAQSEHIEAWRKSCTELADMYLAVLEGLKFCRDTAAPFLSAMGETDSIDEAFSAIGTDGIAICPSEEKLSAESFGGDRKICVKVSRGTFLCFVQSIFIASFNAEVRPRPCGLCGKYFLPNNNIAKFCDRKAPDGSGKLCREVGARRKYEKKQKGNPISAAYTRVYKARYARMTNGKMTKEEMNAWTEKAVALRTTALSENMSAEEFEQMLKNL